MLPAHGGHFKLSCDSELSLTRQRLDLPIDKLNAVISYSSQAITHIEFQPDIPFAPRETTSEIARKSTRGIRFGLDSMIDAMRNGALLTNM